MTPHKNHSLFHIRVTFKQYVCIVLWFMFCRVSYENLWFVILQLWFLLIPTPHTSFCTRLNSHSHPSIKDKNYVVSICTRGKDFVSFAYSIKSNICCFLRYPGQWYLFHYYVKQVLEVHALKSLYIYSKHNNVSFSNTSWRLWWKYLSEPLLLKHTRYDMF